MISPTRRTGLVQLLCIVLFHLLLVSFAGCDRVRGDNSDQSDDDDSATGDDGDDDDAGDDDDDGADGVTLLTTEECDRICLEREEGIEGTGNCPFDWNSGDCREVCSDYAAFATETEEAFIQCVATDPLCFQDIHDCVLSTRYPDAMVVPFALVATGFGAYESMSVVAALEAGGEDFAYADPQTVTGGGFTAEWEVSTHIAGGHLALYYVDVDGDGDCDPSTDLTGSASMVFGSDIDEPSFSAEVQLPETDASFVCDFI